MFTDGLPLKSNPIHHLLDQFIIFLTPILLLSKAEASIAAIAHWDVSIGKLFHNFLPVAIAIIKASQQLFIFSNSPVFAEDFLVVLLQLFRAWKNWLSFWGVRTLWRRWIWTRLLLFFNPWIRGPVFRNFRMSLLRRKIGNRVFFWIEGIVMRPWVRMVGIIHCPPGGIHQFN